jgi:hypothetical protein
MKPAISVGGRTGTAHNPTVRCDEWGTSRSRGTVCDRGIPRLQSWEDVSGNSGLSTEDFSLGEEAPTLIINNPHNNVIHSNATRYSK